ncbi:hypothetical protein TNCV_4935721 [Trichonephila clavipes]|nr:hypothetical protein TNCV_4935721 [Trichonephila clavipes]
MSGFISIQMVHFWISSRVLVLEVSVIYLFSFYSHVGSHTTHYDNEIEDIHLTIHQLSIQLSTPDKVAILSDSSSAIQALASNQDKSSSSPGLQGAAEQNSNKGCLPVGAFPLWPLGK